MRDGFRWLLGALLAASAGCASYSPYGGPGFRPNAMYMPPGGYYQGAYIVPGTTTATIPSTLPSGAPTTLGSDGATIFDGGGSRTATVPGRVPTPIDPPATRPRGTPGSDDFKNSD